MSAAKARQMGVRYSSAAVTVNSSVKNAWNSVSISSVTPGPTKRPGAVRLRSSHSRSSRLTSWNTSSSPAKSSTSPSRTGSSTSASSPLTKVPPLLRRSDTVQYPPPSRCRLAWTRETLGASSTTSAERERPIMHSQWLTGCLSPFRSTR